MTRKFAIISLILGISFSIVLLGLLAGFVPQREGPEVRRRVSNAIAQMSPEDLPTPIAAGDNQSWVVRAVAVSPDAPLPQPLQYTPEQKNVVVFLDEGVSLVTEGYPKTLENDLSEDAFVPVLPLDGTQDALYLVTVPPADYGESLDIGGRPVRWLAVQDATVRRLDPECDATHPVATINTVRTDRVLTLLPLYAFNSGDTFTRARRYKDLVERSSRRYGLDAELIYAIIHNESNFSPIIVSSQSAMGLMQVRPSTAGGEVHKFLYGHTGKVSYADLANPEVNIQYGTAYLHLLMNRHLGDVRNPVSREYCAVAAYNMGPNKFLRLFSTDKDTAIEHINAMTQEELFRYLTTHLPVQETRFFVAKVARSRGEFASFQ